MFKNLKQKIEDETGASPVAPSQKTTATISLGPPGDATENKPDSGSTIRRSSSVLSTSRRAMETIEAQKFPHSGLQATITLQQQQLKSLELLLQEKDNELFKLKKERKEQSLPKEEISISVFSKDFPNIESSKAPAALITELSDLKARNSNLQKAYDDYRLKTGDLLSKKDSHITRMQDRVSSLENRLQEQQNGDKMHSLLADRDLIKQKYEHLEKAYEQEKQSWSEHVKKLDKELSDSRAKHLTEITRYQDELTKRLAELESERQKAGIKCDCAALKIQLAEMQQKLEAEDLQHSQELKNALSYHAEEIKNLQEECDTLRNECKLLIAANSELKNENQRLLAVKTELDKIIEMDTINQREPSPLNAPDAEKLHLLEKLEETKDMFETMDIESEQHITTLANQVEDLVEALGDTQRDLNVMNRELGEKDHVVGSLQQKITSLEGMREMSPDSVGLGYPQNTLDPSDIRLKSSKFILDK